MKAPSYRSGVTLLEMLIAIVVSSVVMLGCGTLYQTAMVNYNVLRDVRENVYTGTLTNDRITEAVKKPNRAAITVQTISCNCDPPDPATSRDVIVYNYRTGAFQTGNQNHSGIIYYYLEKLYLFENEIGTDFSTMSVSQIKAWVETRSNRDQSELIGYGVLDFDANVNTMTWKGSSETFSRGVTWTVSYLTPGRG